MRDPSSAESARAGGPPQGALGWSIRVGQGRRSGPITSLFPRKAPYLLSKSAIRKLTERPLSDPGPSVQGSGAWSRRLVRDGLGRGLPSAIVAANSATSRVADGELVGVTDGLTCEPVRSRPLGNRAGIWLLGRVQNDRQRCVRLSLGGVSGMGGPARRPQPIERHRKRQPGQRRDRTHEHADPRRARHCTVSGAGTSRSSISSRTEYPPPVPIFCSLMTPPAPLYSRPPRNAPRSSRRSSPVDPSLW